MTVEEFSDKCELWKSKAQELAQELDIEIHCGGWCYPNNGPDFWDGLQLYVWDCENNKEIHKMDVIQL